MHAGAGPNRSFHSYSKDINFVSKILDGHEIKNTCELAIFLAIFSGEVMDTIVSITETLASLYYGFDALPSTSTFRQSSSGFKYGMTFSVIFGEFSDTNCTKSWSK